MKNMGESEEDGFKENLVVSSPNKNVSNGLRIEERQKRN
jgi:hypothetical protein